LLVIIAADDEADELTVDLVDIAMPDRVARAPLPDEPAVSGPRLSKLSSEWDGPAPPVGVCGF